MQKNRKLLYFIIALVVSLGLWVYVVTVENPEDSATLHNIPVVFEGQDVIREDYDLIITDDNVGSGVSLTFYGKLTDLNKLRENQSDIVVTIDLTRNVRSARDYSFSYDISNISLPSSLDSSNIKVTDTSPSNVDITVSNLKKKTIDVKVLQEVQTVEGYIAERYTLDYDQLEIEGPEDAVQQVSYALVTLRRENVDKTIVATLDYILMDGDGNVVEDDEITSDVTQIEITLPVSAYKDVPLEIGIIDGGGATSADVTTDIDPKTIRLSGDAATLDAIQSIKLSNIDMATLMSNSETLTRTIPIPDGCNNLSGVQEALVDIRIPNKTITKLSVRNTNFQFINVPEGVHAEFKTTALLVTIRGNTSDINQIEAENVRVVADLSNVSVQDNSTSTTVPVTIYVDGFEGAGAVGTDYTVVVDLTPATDDD